jgi:cobalt-zinc-cadmium efflux system outer membrane protein
MPGSTLALSRAGRAALAPVLALAVALPGCTVAAGSSRPQPRPLGSGLPVYEAPRETRSEGRPPPEPTGVISLRDALAAALMGNPELAAFSWEIRAREARTLQAGLMPNPELDTELEDFGGSGARRGWRSSQTTVSLSQLVELGGKRHKRRRIAALEEELAGWDYEARRLGVLTEVTKAFIQVLETQERLALVDDLRRLAEQSVKTVAATVRAGAVSFLEEGRAKVAVSRTVLDRARLGRELDAARAALAALWGASTVTFDRVRGDLETLTPPPAPESLRAGLAANPDLARWTAELEAREAAVDLETARRIPDIRVGFGGRYLADGDDGALVTEVTVPLPLIDRNQGAILEAERRLAKAAVERHAAEASLHARLAAAYQALGAAFERAETMRRTTIPQAESVYAGAADGYAKGLFRYLEVLDAQRTLFELRSEYLQALGAYHTAAADLERLTGAPLHGACAGEDR